MPFFPSCSIDGCLRIFEPEIRYSLCPKTKKGALEYDMNKLKQSKDLTVQTITELVSNGERETNVEVVAWMENVDKLNDDVYELLSSLSTNRCWQLCSNYESARNVEEMQRRVDGLVNDRNKWDDPNKLLKDKPPQVSPSTATENLEGSSTEQEPWRLFRSYMMGGAADVSRNKYIDGHARDIVDSLVECCGSGNERLNLAMRVVAGSLKKHSTVRPWEDAADKLRDIAASQENITGTPVLESILRFCYDSLSSKRLKDCLSSYASFDYNSPVCEDAIIASWMGEGLLDDRVNIDEAYDQGHRVIRKLRDAHWLKSSHWCDYYLNMDDHIQYMVRSASGDREIRMSVAIGQELQSWSDFKARRVSVKQPINSLPDNTHAFMEAHLPEGTPECPHLIALHLGSNDSIKKVHRDFFRFTPQLLVLDLSYTEIEEIPPSIGLLKFLRLLKLTKTKICSLPIELGNLEDLRQLEMNDNRQLKGILRECITKLSNLQALHMSDNGPEWSQPGSEYLSLENLRDMAGIQQLYLTARTNSDLTKIRSLFGSALTGLTLEGRDFTDMRSVFSSLTRLEYFEISGCPRLENLIIGNGHLGRVREIVLVELRITVIAPEADDIGSEGFTSFLPTLRHLGLRCHSLRNLTWLGRLAKLELVCLQDCEGISMLMDKGGSSDTSAGSEGSDDGSISFPNLQFLLLYQLPRLSSFSWRHPLRLPSLRTLRVKDCPKLKKLPFGQGSCKDIREIKGTWDWWNGLQWDHKDIQECFVQYFKAF